MSLPLFIKSPTAKLDYGFDWSAYLGSLTITASLWFVSADVTVVSDSFSNNKTGILLTGGNMGQRYLVTNRITRSDAEIDERSFTLSIQTT